MLIPRDISWLSFNGRVLQMSFLEFAWLPSKGCRTIAQDVKNLTLT